MKGNLGTKGRVCFPTSIEVTSYWEQCYGHTSISWLKANAVPSLLSPRARQSFLPLPHEGGTHTSTGTTFTH